MKVHFHFLSPIGLRNRKKLKIFLESLSKKENTRLAEITYIFCSDAFLLNMNKQFLQHDFYTDIISFEISNDPLGKVAEIYISTDRVKENAKIFKTSITSELHRVIFHGILHICGYKDKTKDQKNIMSAKEDYYLSAYF
ncbi:MAG: rRNA maturation RNase YbeY [Niastella sp. SCN 39-18]|nr:rRNA maturation RNase YbeY [Sphingobacteriales bacterium]ODT52618.1 MAG: rRNA maturation RNase YbeY [Niastella sp. SCN 39-18]OJW11758.1 MAG: rRNA maturation RNase YbeY [Sphingobacteriales bacterium 39-19]